MDHRLQKAVLSFSLIWWQMTAASILMSFVWMVTEDQIVSKSLTLSK